MRILGIDPGLATMGWGVLDVNGSKNHLVECGAIITPPDMAMPNRLHNIFLDVKTLIVTYQPDEIVFEELFFAKNVTTALNVGAARGVAQNKLCCLLFNCSVVSNSLQLYGLQHPRLPCPSLSPRVCSN